MWFDVISKKTIEQDGKLIFLNTKAVAFGEKVIEWMGMEPKSEEATEFYDKTESLTAGGRSRGHSEIQQEFNVMNRKYDNLVRGWENRYKEYFWGMLDTDSWGKVKQNSWNKIRDFGRKLPNLRKKLKDYLEEEKQAERTAEENAIFNAKRKAIQESPEGILALAEDSGIVLQGEMLDDFLMYMRHEGFEPEAIEGIAATITSQAGSSQFQHEPAIAAFGEEVRETPLKDNIINATRQLIVEGVDLSTARNRWKAVRESLNIDEFDSEWGDAELKVIDNFYDSPEAKRLEERAQKFKAHLAASEKREAERTPLIEERKRLGEEARKRQRVAIEEGEERAKSRKRQREEKPKEAKSEKKK